MTAKEFYEWAIENNAEDLEIEIQYRNSGGLSYRETEIFPEIEQSEYDNNNVVLL